MTTVRDNSEDAETQRRLPWNEWLRRTSQLSDEQRAASERRVERRESLRRALPPSTRRPGSRLGLLSDEEYRRLAEDF